MRRSETAGLSGALALAEIGSRPGAGGWDGLPGTITILKIACGFLRAGGEMHESGMI